ncbi:helix-turn-helix domain-containing protein [Sphingomonas sp. IW22]|uniref:helix-turn-helix domain-containing protein n=1 Tax=Sphingomonas sp. IW22 TaxID=3242489 RepID=UPI0035206FB4
MNYSPSGLFDFGEKAAARIVGVSPRTLRRWREAGKVGHYVTPGGRIRYTMEQLIELQRGCRQRSEAAE